MSSSTEISTKEAFTPTARPPPPISLVSRLTICILHIYWRFFIDPPVEFMATASYAGITSAQDARLSGDLVADVLASLYETGRWSSVASVPNVSWTGTGFVAVPGRENIGRID